MNPVAVRAAGTLFLACLAIHVALWRYLRVRRIPVLFAVFLGPVPLVMVVAALLPGRVAWDVLIGALVGHCALACAYIQTYPALDPVAPSLRILLLVAAAGSRGAAAGELDARLGTGNLVRENFEPLVAGRLLERGAGSERFQLTARGEALLRPFRLYRRVLGLPPGDG